MSQLRERRHYAVTCVRQALSARAPPIDEQQRRTLSDDHLRAKSFETAAAMRPTLAATFRDLPEWCIAAVVFAEVTAQTYTQDLHKDFKPPGRAV